MRAWWSAVVAIGASVTVVPGDDGAFADEVLLRVAPNAGPALIEAIATNGEPRLGIVRRGENVYEHIRLRCGSVHPDYWQLLQGRNSDVADQFAEGTARENVLVEFPACAHWSTFGRDPSLRDEDGRGDDFTLLVHGQTLEDLAWQQIGLFGPKTIAEIARLNGFAQPDRIPPAGTVLLPYRSSAVTISVADANAFAEAIFAALPNSPSFPGFDVTCGASKDVAQLWSPIVNLCLNYEVQAVAPVPPEPPPSAGCPAQYSRSELPDIADVLEAVETVEMKLPKSSGKRRREQSVVVVADTGLVGYRDYQHLLADSVLGGTSFNDYTGDDGSTVIGETMTLTDKKYVLEPDTRFSHSDIPPWHGTHVFGIVAGAALRNGDVASLADYFKFNVANLIDPGFGESPEFSGTQIERAREFSVKRTADILNLSVENSARLREIENNLFPGLLLVAAAGNPGARAPGRGVELGKGIEIYPAMYGGARGMLRDKAISVAAFGPGGALAAFSARSQDYVDLAAPGVGIASLTDITPGRADCTNGTSQAAPFVSMTAALLYYLRGRAARDPWLVKQRILSAVDADRGLYGDAVFSRGRLNIVKALRFDSDIVQLKGSSKLLYGAVEFAPEDLCEDSDKVYDRKKLTKIVPNYGAVDVKGKTSKTHLIMYSPHDGNPNQDQRLEVNECVGKEFAIRFSPETGQPITMPSDMIEDIVLRAVFWKGK